MSRKPFTVLPTSPLFEVWKTLYKKGVHGLPVVDKTGKLVGIISEEDILVRLYPSYDEFVLNSSSRSFEGIEQKSKEIVGLRAKDIMSKKVYLTKGDTSIIEALSKMMVYSVRQLPVIDKKNKLIGIISRGDIFDTLFKKYLKR